MSAIHGPTLSDGGYQHPPTWWFELLSRWFPSRCREIPEATDTSRILIRQFAVVKKHVYLQQFASSENFVWFHSHPWRWGAVAIGLWGAVSDRKYNLLTKNYSAPYFRYMDRDHIHQTIRPSAGHTSLFIGLGPKTDDKYYFPLIKPKHWTEHIKKLVKRI